MEQIKKTIILVDDESIVLDCLAEQIQNLAPDDYIIEMAESGEEAIELVEELVNDKADIKLIISDWLMPGMRGDKLLIRIHEKYPKIDKVILTGQANEGALDNAFENAGLKTVIYKPWEEQELIGTLKTLL